MEILDSEFLLRNVDRDPELLREIVDLFFETSDESMNGLRSAVKKADPHALHETAHQLKGMLANVGGNKAAEAALRLETLGRHGMLSGLEDAMDELENEFERLVPALQAMVAAHG